MVSRITVSTKRLPLAFPQSRVLVKYPNFSLCRWIICRDTVMHQSIPMFIRKSCYEYISRVIRKFLRFRCHRLKFSKREPSLFSATELSNVSFKRHCRTHRLSVLEERVAKYDTSHVTSPLKSFRFYPRRLSTSRKKKQTRHFRRRSYNSSVNCPSKNVLKTFE